tara:strand:+ start:33 stop:191 length:159 start_codon:yes stop_codon:yes gene_type:complete
MTGQQDRLAKDDWPRMIEEFNSFVIKSFSMLGEMTVNHVIAFGDEEGANESS